MVLTDRARILFAVAMTAFSAGVIAVTAFSWITSVRIQDIRAAHTQEIASLKRLQTQERKELRSDLGLCKDVLGYDVKKILAIVETKGGK